MNRTRYVFLTGLSVLLSNFLLFASSAYAAQSSTDYYGEQSFASGWATEKFNSAFSYNTEQPNFSSDSSASRWGAKNYNIPSFQLQSPLWLAQTGAEQGAADAGSSVMSEEEKTRRVKEVMQMGPLEQGEAVKKMSPELKERLVAEAMLNPLSNLWLLFAQNDTTWYDGDILDALGEDAKVQNTTLLMPVMPFQLTENWKLVTRVVLPINNFDTVDNVDISTGSVPGIRGVNFERETGIGDIVLWGAFTKWDKPPFIWGFGPTIMLDTASEPQLGTGKNSIGPMALAFKITDKWIIGGVAQHWWSVGGKDTVTVNTNVGPVTVERPDVSLTDIQYILRYRYSPETNIGAAPNIRYNWETDQLYFPIGIGFDTLVKIGPLPTKIGAEIHYYVETNDDFGPKWLLRLYFSPVIPSPAWAKKPLF